MRAHPGVQRNPPTTEAIVRAYVEPAFRLSMEGGVGWKNYMKMLGSAMSNRQRDAFLAPILEQFSKGLNPGPFRVPKMWSC